MIASASCGIMKTLLIVVHSLTGGSQHMAQAAFAGARQEQGVTVLLKQASEVHTPDLLGAQACLFVGPETLGSITGMMKDLFDRCYYPALDHMAGKAYALMVCAGSDGHGAVRQLQRILTGWRMKEVAEPLIVCTQAQTPKAIAAPKHISENDLAQCEQLGQAVAAGLAMGLY